MANRLTLPFLKGPIHLGNALDGDDDMLAKLQYPQPKKEFFNYLLAHEAAIENLIRGHLGIDNYHVCVMEIWKSGNLTVFVRFPLPYKVGEANNPGNVEEKLRTEIAANIWLQEQRPDVSIPLLPGFGLPDGQCFTHPRNAPFFAKAMLGVKRFVLFCPGLASKLHATTRDVNYTIHSNQAISSSAKRRTDLFIGHGKIIDTISYRTRLFRGLARISLSVNKTPFPRIGSLTLDSRKVITLSNRPLTLFFQMLENESIPSGIPRQRTYGSGEPYISDLLSFQDNRFLYQPNAVHNQDDGEMQLAALTALRATMHRSIRPKYRDGPFFFTLTDLHRSNIFVDEPWNI